MPSLLDVLANEDELRQRYNVDSPLTRALAGKVRDTVTFPQRLMQSFAQNPVGLGLSRSDYTDIPGAEPANPSVGMATDLAMNMVGAPMFTTNAATLGSGAMKGARSYVPDIGEGKLAADAWVLPRRSGAPPLEVLVNPSSKDIRGLSSGNPNTRLRYLADSDGNKYVWDANYGTHYDFFDGLKDAGQSGKKFFTSGENQDFNVKELTEILFPKKGTTLGSGSTDERTAAMVQGLQGSRAANENEFDLARAIQNLIQNNPELAARAAEPMQAASNPFVQRSLANTQRKSDARMDELTAGLPNNPTADDILRAVLAKALEQK